MFIILTVPGGWGRRERGLSDHVINFKKTLTSGQLGVHSLLSHLRVCDVEQARLTVPGVSASATWRHTPLWGLAWRFVEPLMLPSPAETNPDSKVGLTWWLLLRLHFLLCDFFLPQFIILSICCSKLGVGWEAKKGKGKKKKWIRYKGETLQRFLKLPTRPENDSLRQFKESDTSV